VAVEPGQIGFGHFDSGQRPARVRGIACPQLQGPAAGVPAFDELDVGVKLDDIAMAGTEAHTGVREVTDPIHVRLQRFRAAVCREGGKSGRSKDVVIRACIST
jgi:hypothetical protein